MNFYLFSLGCKVNSYELDALRNSLEKEGNHEVFSPIEADLVIVNTCSVTSTADQKSRQHIRKMRRLSPNAVLAVMGCYSELHAEETAEMGADIVLGTSKRRELLADVERFKKEGKKIIDVKKDVRHEHYEEMGQMALADNARAYLKIQDGCDNFCSYCLIPRLRGNSRSREKDETLREAKRLVEAGYKEIVIAGIHIGGYGKDLGDGSYRLGNLLEDMLDLSPELPRLRISSIEESEIDSTMLNLLKNYPQVVDHLHIPLQSGSSSVLKRMKRKYDTSAFLKTLSAIRTIRPNIAITTDIIVGFPEESDEEWKETLAFAKKAEFAEIHVFPFSPRNGTYAATLPDTPAPIKEARVQELLSLSKELRETYEERFYGQSLSILFEEDDPKNGLAYGHSGNYLLVKTASSEAKHGQIASVVYSPLTKAD
ncbi:MAG: tRNA (N(6)-L-threonylcarbamoyladenosine(37)-C(2))-methylthiotransferase MtaB [Bacilli bacterium]